jgi:hypothetical protein
MKLRRRSAVVGLLRVLAGCWLLAAAGCRPGTPVIDPGERPATREGTISGRVLGPGRSPIPNRVVRATDSATGSTFTGTTNEAGGYSIKVPPGTYTMAVDLEPGERVARQPGKVQINESDLDTGIDFTIERGAAR